MLNMEILCFRFGPLDGLLERRVGDNHEEVEFTVGGTKYVEDHVFEVTGAVTVTILTPEAMIGSLSFADRADIVAFLANELADADGKPVDLDSLPKAEFEALADDEEVS